jgi:hypothetical protein
MMIARARNARTTSWTTAEIRYSVPRLYIAAFKPGGLVEVLAASAGEALNGRFQDLEP